jgi:transposase-like protein
VLVERLAVDQFPRSLNAFERSFGDEAACAEYLAKARWPKGFVCPNCNGSKAWRLETKSWTWECARCGRQTSVTAGTIMHHSRLPLTTWFWAAYVMATQPTGISALQLQRELGLGSYKTAWLLCAKLRCCMLAPDRSPLAGLVEVAETAIPFHGKNDAAVHDGRGTQRNMLIAGAVEVEDLRPGRLRLTAMRDRSATNLQSFLAANVAPGVTAKVDGGAECRGDPSIDDVGTGFARTRQLRIDRIFGALRTWVLGVYHGLRRRHLQSYLDEFVFRFETRRARHAAFPVLIALAASHPPLTYGTVVVLA